MLAKSRWDAQRKVHHAIPINQSSIRPSITTTTGRNVTLLADMDCLFTVKMAFPEVFTFIHSFLLQPIEKLDQSSSSSKVNDTKNSLLVLDIHCPLYLFIRQHLHECRPAMSMAHHNSTRFRLVEPISCTDDFGAWSYDHLHGLFDLELAPHGSNVQQFPDQWSLADDVKIYWRIENESSREKTSLSSYTDRSHRRTLEAFVHDICMRENNGKSGGWLEALRQEDILTFEHLTNLNQSEWDRIHRLPVNAKRILKSAVDQERTNIAGEYRRQIIKDLNDQNNEETESIMKTDSSISQSELFANLHLIKLFVWYKLRDHRVVQRYGALAKLEMKCLDATFDEMRSEGFADDGLFPKIQEFFLLLTISERELHMERSANIVDIRVRRCKELRTDIE